MGSNIQVVMYTVSQNNRATFFAQLLETLADFDNFWQAKSGNNLT